MGIISIIAFIAILGALAAAGYFMLRSSGPVEGEDPASAEAQARQKRMAQALTVRIAVSVLLFITVLVAWYLGWIKPSGLPVSK
jgi:hypothetical protein